MHKMSKLTIKLPPKVDHDNTAELIAALAPGRGHSGEVLVDMYDVTSYQPHAICMLAAQLDYWNEKGAYVEIRQKDGSEISKYLGKIGLLSNQYHTQAKLIDWRKSKDYVPIEVIENGSRPESVADALAGSAAEMAGSDDEVRQLIRYAVFEFLMNVKQHSRAAGFIMSQYYPKTGLYHIGVADWGIGIRQSFLESTSPFVKGMENSDDAGWLDSAIRPKFSSKTHLRNANGSRSDNHGVGLSITRAFTRECLGRFQLVSQYGMLDHDFVSAMNEDKDEPRKATMMEHSYNGVACSITFNPTLFGNTTYQQLRRDVLNQLGLGGNESDLGLFGS
jgi:hypothetical protein